MGLEKGIKTLHRSWNLSMKVVYKYLSIYREFFKTSLSEELSFRANFTLQSLMNVLLIGVYFFTSIFIFDHVEHIGLWGEKEFLFFLAFVFAVDQTHYLIFAANFWEFSEKIRLGNLDFYLLKPVPSLFIILMRNLAVPGLFTVGLTYFMLVYFGIQLNFSLLVWFSLPFCLLLSLSLLLGIEVLISLCNFFTVEGLGINQARLQVQQLTRWPDFIYKNPARIWLFPFLAVTSIPVRWLLSISYWQWLVFMFFGVILLWSLIFYVWPRALRFYESPSS